MNEKIRDALSKLEEQLVSAFIILVSINRDFTNIHFKEQDKESASSEEVTKAKDALVAGQAAAKESSS